MPAPSPRPIDYTALRFPSDTVSVSDLRRLHPALFDVHRPAGIGRSEQSLGSKLGSMILLERLVARAAFDHAETGRRGVASDPCLSLDDCIDELKEHYRNFGLANGEHQARELVRGLQAQAASQAPSRPRPV